MEILRPSVVTQETNGVATLKPGVIKRIDCYLRRTDTLFAELASALCSYKGDKYLNSRLKRWFDLCIAVPAVVVATPAIVILGIAKKLEDGGSVFFVQERLGRGGGETIDVVKIRCMRLKSDVGIQNLSIAKGLEASQDPRNTRLGALMRKYQLEELPQLFQVVQGKLSVMGVRPGTHYGFDYLRKVWSEDRYDSWVAAYRGGPLGVSGLNQALGSKLKEEEKRYHLDVFYTRNASLGLDLYLLWKTAIRLIGADRGR